MTARCPDCGGPLVPGPTYSADFVALANEALADVRAWVTPHGLALPNDLTDAETQAIAERLARLSVTAWRLLKEQEENR
jgi:hypothetical protein